MIVMMVRMVSDSHDGQDGHVSDSPDGQDGE